MGLQKSDTTEWLNWILENGTQLDSDIPHPKDKEAVIFIQVPEVIWIELLGENVNSLRLQTCCIYKQYDFPECTDVGSWKVGGIY